MERKPRLVLILGYAIFFIGGGLFLLMTTKPESFLILASFHTPFLDGLMRNWTHLGNGITALVFALLIGFRKIRWGVYFLITYAFSGVLVQILKRHVFADVVRPLKYFSDLGQEIALVPGVSVYQYNSFPSGHTATAFALFVGIAMLVKNKIVQAVCLILAIGVAYSRVYLAQHFPADVIAGSLIGVVTAWAFYAYVSRWQSAWLDRPLIKMSDRKPTI